jgi:hypothetical protein
MKKCFLVLVFLGLMGCSSKEQIKELDQLTGYWEIEKAVFPNGAEKIYKSNTTIDFFHFEENQGYRKKVQPLLNGQYQTSDDAQKFKLITLDDQGVYLEYSNGSLTWQEQLKAVDSVQLILESEQNITYFYKRYQAIAL